MEYLVIPVQSKQYFVETKQELCRRKNRNSELSSGILREKLIHWSGFPVLSIILIQEVLKYG